MEGERKCRKTDGQADRQAGRQTWGDGRVQTALTELNTKGHKVSFVVWVSTG